MKLDFLSPVDQPKGIGRLFDRLVALLDEPVFTDLRIVSAFAKEGPLIRLQGPLTKWKANGGTASAIIGVDQRMSYESLRFEERGSGWDNPSSNVFKMKEEPR